MEPLGVPPVPEPPEAARLAPAPPAPPQARTRQPDNISAVDQVEEGEIMVRSLFRKDERLVQQFDLVDGAITHPSTD